MVELERYLEKRMNPVFRTYYSLWVHWWPVWRRITGRSIIRKWSEFGIFREGQVVLDYGCGTGDFTILAARIVNDSGKVYALDYFKKQLDIVQRRLKKRGIRNVETIHSDNKTGLPDESVDVVWMCDVLHEVRRRKPLIEELHRVLRYGGSLVVYDGMGDKALKYTYSLFSLADRDEKLMVLVKV